MRDIKFRAWDKQNKKMVEVDLLGENVLHIKNSEWENVEDFEVMEFTGLKDKNGVEIYEGDIVSDGKNKYVVAFYMGAWRLKRNVDGDTWWKSLYRYVTNFRVEVIGNVYENPELLKEDK